MLSSFGRSMHTRCAARVNNRNFTTLLHGIQHREELFEALKDEDTIEFARDSSFPPLKSSSTYDLPGAKKVVCQNQLYKNSFSVNTQRQSLESLHFTSPQFLAPVLENATVDLSLNWICCTWEERLHRKLCAFEKCQLILHVALLRRVPSMEEHSAEFAAALSDIQIQQEDNSWSKNLYSIRRTKTYNPEYAHLPQWVKDALDNGEVNISNLISVSRIISKKNGPGEAVRIET